MLCSFIAPLAPIISAVITSVSVCFAFFIGLRIGRKEGAEQKEAEKKRGFKLPNIPTPGKIKQKRADDKQRKIEEAIWRNIEIFDGTSKGQKEIKK